MIHFNTPEGSKERQETKPLTLQEENKVIGILNKLVFTIEEEEILQRFVNHYQNLNHHMVSTCGLYATDQAILANHEGFFQIKF